MKGEKQVWFTKEQHKEIKVAASKNGLSMKGYVVKLVKEDIQEKKE